MIQVRSSSLALTVLLLGGVAPAHSADAIAGYAFDPDGRVESIKDELGTTSYNIVPVAA